jgi:dienelactone hydrolase
LFFLGGIDRVKATPTKRSSQAKEAAEDGWNNMQAWFKKYKVLG